MRTTWIAGLGLVALALAGCAKRSAESAIGQAEKTIAGMQAEAEKVAPNELKALVDSVAAMKARVAAGDHSGALMGARTVGTMARDLAANLAGRKEQLTNSYNAAAAEMPKQLEAVTARINELAGMRRLPAGIDAASFSALKDEAATWSATWTAAADAFKAGNLAAALTQANQLKSRLAVAAKALGIG